MKVYDGNWRNDGILAASLAAVAVVAVAAAAAAADAVVEAAFQHRRRDTDDANFLGSNFLKNFRRR